MQEDFKLIRIVFYSLVISYVLGFFIIVLDPWWEDNGVAVFIEWRDRWAWAAMFAGFIGMFLVPLALMWRLSRKL